MDGLSLRETALHDPLTFPPDRTTPAFAPLAERDEAGAGPGLLHISTSGRLLLAPPRAMFTGVQRKMGPSGSVTTKGARAASSGRGHGRGLLGICNWEPRTRPWLLLPPPGGTDPGAAGTRRRAPQPGVAQGRRRERSGLGARPEPGSGSGPGAQRQARRRLSGELEARGSGQPGRCVSLLAAPGSASDPLGGVGRYFRVASRRVTAPRPDGQAGDPRRWARPRIPVPRGSTLPARVGSGPVPSRGVEGGRCQEPSLARPSPGGWRWQGGGWMDGWRRLPWRAPARRQAGEGARDPPANHANDVGIPEGARGWAGGGSGRARRPGAHRQPQRRRSRRWAPDRFGGRGGQEGGGARRAQSAPRRRQGGAPAARQMNIYPPLLAAPGRPHLGAGKTPGRRRRGPPAHRGIGVPGRAAGAGIDGGGAVRPGRAWARPRAPARVSVRLRGRVSGLGTGWTPPQAARRALPSFSLPPPVDSQTGHRTRRGLRDVLSTGGAARSAGKLRTKAAGWRVPAPLPAALRRCPRARNPAAADRAAHPGPGGKALLGTDARAGPQGSAWCPSRPGTLGRSRPGGRMAGGADLPGGHLLRVQFGVGAPGATRVPDADPGGTWAKPMHRLGPRPATPRGRLGGPRAQRASTPPDSGAQKSRAAAPPPPRAFQGPRARRILEPRPPGPPDKDPRARLPLPAKSPSGSVRQQQQHPPRPRGPDPPPARPPPRPSAPPGAAVAKAGRPGPSACVRLARPHVTFPGLRLLPAPWVQASPWPAERVGLELWERTRRGVRGERGRAGRSLGLAYLGPTWLWGRGEGWRSSALQPRAPRYPLARPSVTLPGGECG
ncbi:collagen alpha-1(I) chain-like [Suncus etruscus]|uniref:collagen alpha-1(I) chain-like n=1 Tax=Suncus etruscus TaxID=109475 RepID=UPI0021104177|nr:collagen alpha-1(I) chain-like [Suncus etruscus]